MLLRELPPEKYWSMPASYSKEKRELEIESMINSGNYYWQLKTDGNYSAFICDFDGDKRMISRGVSVVTKEYGRVEDKLFFFSDIARVFNKPTRIMGEIYYDNGVDKNVGSVLRAAAIKSKSIQSEKFYQESQKITKFTAKDRRDIEGNVFYNQPLKWRIFDIWYYDGIDLMSTPWIERQKYVKEAAERINNPLVTAVPYTAMTDQFYEQLNDIFAAGGEGVVAYRADGLPEPDKRTAHKTCKIKRELESSLDVFIVGIEPAVKEYTGKSIGSWEFWENTRTGEKLYGQFFSQYQLGEPLMPVSKGYYYNWPGAIYTAVYDKQGNEVPVCKVSGLTEEFKIELRDHYEKYDHCPIKIGGMAISTSNFLSVRHPYLQAIRAEDIDVHDCTLEKILN